MSFVSKTIGIDVRTIHRPIFVTLEEHPRDIKDYLNGAGVPYSICWSYLPHQTELCGHVS